LLKRVFQHKWKQHDRFTERYNCDRLARDVTKADQLLAHDAYAQELLTCSNLDACPYLDLPCLRRRFRCICTKPVNPDLVL
jgi:hypothetical protein